MTAVPPTQPPAAPETDASALREWAARFLVQCGPCDGGLPMQCSCTTEDERPLIAALLDALDAARERVRVVEGERDAARSEHNESCATTDQFRDQKARAESAEAAHAEAERLRALWFGENSRAQAELANEKDAHRALQAAVEALAADFDSNVDWSAGRNNYGDNEAWESAARQARALLAGGEER